MNDAERLNLIRSLRSNSEHGTAIMMNPRDTSFIGSATDELPAETVDLISSMPTHY